MKPSTKKGQINKKHLAAHKRKLKRSEVLKALKTPTSSMNSFSTAASNISITNSRTSTRGIIAVTSADMVDNNKGLEANLLTMDDCDKSNDGNPDFYNTGRVGRRNALPDILGQHCMTSTADLPDQLSGLSTNDGKTGPSDGGGPSTNGNINKSTTITTTTNPNTATITTSQKNTS